MYELNYIKLFEKCCDFLKTDIQFTNTQLEYSKPRKESIYDVYDWIKESTFHSVVFLKLPFWGLCTSESLVWFHFIFVRRSGANKYGDSQVFSFSLDSSRPSKATYNHIQYFFSSNIAEGGLRCPPQDNVHVR